MKVTPEILEELGFVKYGKADIYELYIDLGKGYNSVYIHYMSIPTELSELQKEIINFVKQGTEDVIKEKLIGKLL